MDGLKGVLLAALGVLEAGLDRLSRAQDRIVLRRFLNDHPDVDWFWNDGTN